MNIRLSREVNTNQGNRVEYWFNNFDFVDGGAYIAEILKQDYGLRIQRAVARGYRKCCLHDAAGRADAAGAGDPRACGGGKAKQSCSGDSGDG